MVHHDRWNVVPTLRRQEMRRFVVSLLGALLLASVIVVPANAGTTPTLPSYRSTIPKTVKIGDKVFPRSKVKIAFVRKTINGRTTVWVNPRYRKYTARMAAWVTEYCGIWAADIYKGPDPISPVQGSGIGFCKSPTPGTYVVAGKLYMFNLGSNQWEVFSIPAIRSGVPDAGFTEVRPWAPCKMVSARSWLLVVQIYFLAPDGTALSGGDWKLEEMRCVGGYISSY